MRSAESLSCRRNRRLVLDGVDLHVRHRELVAVVGATGAGKTTLPECFLGLHALRLATRGLAFAQRVAMRVALLKQGALVEPLGLTASRRAFHADSCLSNLVA